MSHFSESVAYFCDHFWELVQPYDDLVQQFASEASRVGDLETSLATVLALVDDAFDYQREATWQANEALKVSHVGDCKSLSLFTSGVLFAMGQPHYLVMGHLHSQTSEGHIWVEVEDPDSGRLYVLETTAPALYVLQRTSNAYPYTYSGTPYEPVERIRIA